MAGVVQLTRPIADEDVAAWRRVTPGCVKRTHLNNAGAALMPQPVIDAITGHIALESQIGGYEAAAAATPATAATYAAIAELIGARPHNIAVRSSATSAYQSALASFDFGPGDVIVTSLNDYISNQLMFLSLAARQGVRVVRAEDALEGGLDPVSLRTLVERHRPKLVALTWIPTNSGLVQPAADVGAICEAFGVPYLLDACQAVGQLPIDVARIKCDFLAATARKFLRGPRGIGFLYVSDAALARGAHPLLVDMRGAEWTGGDSYRLFDGARRFEEWEFPHALVLGMGAAVRYAIDAGIDGISYRAHALAAEARRRLGAIPGVRALDHGARLSAIATFSLGGRSAPKMVQTLRQRGINTSAHTRADAPIDFARHGETSSLRVSPHYYNTIDEIGVLESALREELAREDA